MLLRGYISASFLSKFSRSRSQHFHRLFFFFRVLTIPTALKLYGIPFICQMFGIVSGLLHNYLKHQPFEPFLFWGSLLGLVFGFQEIAKRVILILATEDFGEILILPNSMDRIRYDNLEMRKKMDDDCGKV